MYAKYGCRFVVEIWCSMVASNALSYDSWPLGGIPWVFHNKSDPKSSYMGGAIVEHSSGSNDRLVAVEMGFDQVHYVHSTPFAR